MTSQTRPQPAPQSASRRAPQPAASPDSPPAARPLLTVEDLSVAFDGHEVVRDVSFSLRPGECLGIVGESGSGKSVTARSLLGLNGPSAQVAATTLDVGADVLTASEQELRALRGRRIGYVLQDALVSLDPLRKVGTEIAEPLRVHGTPRAERPQRVQELLASVSVPEPELRARQLPSELSGGLRQRALIAAALALDPEVLIADEPTTALDVTVQAQILELLEQSLAEGRALILISHDLSVVERLADHVLVMHHGRVVEEGPTSQVLTAPQDAYTRRLLAAIPSADSRGKRLSDLPPAPVALGARAHRAADGPSSGTPTADGADDRASTDRAGIADGVEDAPCGPPPPPRRRRARQELPRTRRPHPGRRRGRLVRAPRGGDPRDRRRVRLRQVHHRVDGPRPHRAHHRRRHPRRRAVDGDPRTPPTGAPTPHRGGAAGPAVLLRPALDRRPHDRRRPPARPLG
jgi:peptide/nickel transport system ATP-binding protein